MKLFIWDRINKRIVEVEGSCLFEIFGERFAAHRDLAVPNWWRVTHVKSGGAAGPGKRTRAEAIADAKRGIEKIGADKLPALCEGFRNSQMLEIANAQAQEAERLARIEARKAKRAAAAGSTH